MRRLISCWGQILLLLFLSVGWGYAQQPPSPSYDLALSKGVHALNEKRFEEAQAAFREALKAKPRDVEATYYLGAAQRSLGQYKAARDTLKQAASLDPSFGPVHFDLGVVDFHLDQYEEALAELLKAESGEPKESPRQAMTQYYLGLTDYKLSRFAEAAPKFLQAATLSPELRLNARYWAGLAFYRQGLFQEARDEFNAVIGTAPDSALAISAKRLLGKIERGPTHPKRWSLGVSLAAQYDSNVILLPEDSPLPQGISDESDIRWVGVVQGNLKILELTRWTATAQYRFYQSLHQDLDRFDVQNHDLGLTILHRPTGKPYHFQFTYTVSDAFVDEEGYLLAHTAAFSAKFSHGPAHLAELRYQYQNKDFRESDLFPNNEDRTGINHAVGLSHSWLFAKQNGNVHTGYTYDQDSARGDDWDYRGHRFNLGLLLPSSVVGGWLQPALEAEVVLRFYENPNSLSTEIPQEEREDRIQIYTLTLSRPFTGWLSGAVQYLYNINHSNVKAYDYDRQIVSVSVTAAY